MHACLLVNKQGLLLLAGRTTPPARASWSSPTRASCPTPSSTCALLRDVPDCVDTLRKHKLIVKRHPSRQAVWSGVEKSRLGQIHLYLSRKVFLS